MTAWCPFSWPVAAVLIAVVLGWTAIVCTLDRRLGTRPAVLDTEAATDVGLLVPSSFERDGRA